VCGGGGRGGGGVCGEREGEVWRRIILWHHHQRGQQLVILWLCLNVENVSRTTVGRDSHLKRDESQEIGRV
jgi:hypothetical protein